MANVSAAQTLRISGGLTIEPAIPLAGGTESAVILNEVSTMKAVTDQTFTLAASATRTFTMSVFLGSSASFVFCQSTNRVSVVDTAYGVAEVGTFYIRQDSSNSIAEIQILNSGSSATTVRVIFGALQ